MKTREEQAQEAWARGWQKSREDRLFNCEDVWKLWQKPTSSFIRSSESLRKMVLGYRKKCTNYAGEKKYEKALLTHKDFHLIGATRRVPEYVRLEVTNHAVPLAKKRSGQTITDCMGVLYDPRGRKHPVAIEIKETANNPWYGVVELLQQMRLMRSNVRGLKEYFEKQISNNEVKGAWGMLLAPEGYYQKNSGRAKGSYKAACELCRYMADKSEARVIIASIDLGIIKFKAGYWPK